MKHPLFLILCLLATMQAFAQGAIVTMTTTKDSVNLYIEWTGSGSITANGVELRAENVNTIPTAADGSVVLMATGDAQLTILRCDENSLTALNLINCPELTVLECFFNSLTALDVTNCPKLTSLDCSFNSLSVLDITNCPELTRLNCAENPLYFLDVTNHPKLEHLICTNNGLTALDVTNCPELTYLRCGLNFLSVLNVTKNPELTRLACSRNTLLALDITKCPKLEYLSADDQFPVLPVAKFDDVMLSIKNPMTFTGTEVSIENISHSGTYTDGFITWVRERESGKVTFDFTTELPSGIIGNPFSGTATMQWTKTKPSGKMLTEEQTHLVTMTTTDDSVKIRVSWTGSGKLIANGVELINADTIENIIYPAIDGLVVVGATGDAQLTDLNCSRNSLTALDIISCPELTSLGCNINSLTSLDVTKCPKLIWLGCNHNLLTDLDVTNCPNLEGIFCSSNLLTFLDVTNCPKLSELFCDENYLSTLDVTNCPELLYLWCYNNTLSALDVTNCPKLIELNCYNNSLSTLDVTNCTKLEDLYCHENSLSTLDVAKCPKLKTLYCSNNALTALDVTNCMELENLYCSKNILTFLDVTKCSELTTLVCSNNALSDLDITNCPKLEYPFAEGQTPVLPIVVTDGAMLRIKTPITLFAKTDIENISHNGEYTSEGITWVVSGESGEVTFDFSKELSYGTFSGTATQPWIKK